jgi:hypothetical protein
VLVYDLQGTIGNLAKRHSTTMNANQRKIPRDSMVITIGESQAKVNPPSDTGI